MMLVFSVAAIVLSVANPRLKVNDEKIYTFYLHVGAVNSWIKEVNYRYVLATHTKIDTNSHRKITLGPAQVRTIFQPRTTEY